MSAQTAYEYTDNLWVHRQHISIQATYKCTGNVWVHRQRISAQTSYECTGNVWVHRLCMSAQARYEYVACMLTYMAHSIHIIGIINSGLSSTAKPCCSISERGAHGICIGTVVYSYWNYALCQCTIWTSLRTPHTVSSFGLYMYVVYIAIYSI